MSRNVSPVKRETLRKAPLFLLCLLVGLLFFSGCDTDPEIQYQYIPVPTDDPLTGTWIDSSWDTTGTGQYDGYIITKYTVSYGNGSNNDLSTFEAATYDPFTVTHTIAEIVYFTPESGVIISLKPADGKFYGTYFSEFQPTQVKLSNAVDSNYVPITATTLEAAKKTVFTEAKTGDYIGYWGGPYIKQ
jgi:hypothetical protein